MKKYECSTSAPIDINVILELGEQILGRTPCIVGQSVCVCLWGYRLGEYLFLFFFTCGISFQCAQFCRLRWSNSGRHFRWSRQTSESRLPFQSLHSYSPLRVIRKVPVALNKSSVLFSYLSNSCYVLSRRGTCAPANTWLLVLLR